jgi:hypothetical protein
MAKKLKPIGVCAICGVDGPLSFEHVPPAAAFNDRRVLRADLADLKESLNPAVLQDPRYKRQPRGAGDYTLCPRCNNLTGGWYGRRYVDWAHQGMSYLQAAPTGSSLALPYRIFPLPVFKQVLCMFASTCGPSLFKSHPALTRFVLNKESMEYPDAFRVFCYLVDPLSRHSRQTGIAGVLNSNRATHLLAEVAFPPFGYVLSPSQESPIDSRLVDISPFAQSRYSGFRRLNIRLPVLSVNTMYPGDYRSVDQFPGGENSGYGPLGRAL